MQPTITPKHADVLELPKVLARLSRLCYCEETAQMALALQPQGDLFTAQKLLDETVQAYQLTAHFGAPSFNGLHNVNGCLTRAAAGGVLGMGELLHIAETLRVIRSLRQWQDNHASDAAALSPYFEVLQPNKYLEDLIFTAIINEEEMSDKASPQLAEIRRKMRAAAGRVREQLDRLIRSKTVQKYLQEPIVTIRSGRFVVPVKAEYRSEITGLVHDTSSSGSTLFVEPTAVVEANNEIKVLESQEREEIERILAALSAEAGTFYDSIKVGFEACCQLDLAFAKAKMAFDMRAGEPRLNDRGQIDLKKARHPLLDPKTVVPTDIRLGTDFDTLVITGPNTGGKTVSLKTLGLLTLMAMCGLMIPAADDSQIAVFGAVFADIGDEQSIEQSLSTFSAHMTNMIDILQKADARSLVLADELGSGTDPVEGAALAIAVLETLRTKGARVAATTHYAELKAFALQTPGVENACCEFDVATLRPTYRLLIGMPGRSNAFAILQRLGMEPGVIERAQTLVSSENKQFEEVVQTLEQSHMKLEEEREQVGRLRAEAKELADRSRTDRENLLRERDRIMQEAREKSQRLIEETRREAQRMMDELEAIKKQAAGGNAAEMLRRAKASVSGGLDRMSDAADPVDQPLRQAYQLPRPLRVGDTVLIADIDKQGVVLIPPDDAGNVYVQAGIIKTKVALENLRLIPAEKTRTAKTARQYGVQSRGSRAVNTELDLRGMATDEALPAVDLFIDQAVLAGLESVTIIHGKGTGVLRQSVRQHLKTHRSVKEFRRGQYGEGEDGVTVVTLK